MKIAIIGATGVLGRAVIPRLLHKSHEILAVSPHPEKAGTLYGNSLKAAFGDMLAPDESLSKLLHDYDAVLNLATAIPPQAEMSKEGAWDRNNALRKEGTPRLLKAVLAAGVKTYVQQSITMAYPDMGENWITEDTAIEGEAVAAMEALVREISPAALNWVILRGAVFVGKDTFQEDTIRSLKEKQAIMACDGQAYRSYIHVEDMAEAVVLAMENSPAGGIFNICDDPMREIDYLSQVAAAIGADAPLNNPELPCPLSQRCSNQSAMDVLGWIPTHDIIPKH
jgi:nucleoside-diphosphate-sugar epimerase